MDAGGKAFRQRDVQDYSETSSAEYHGDRDTKTAEQIILNDDKLDALHKKTFELAQSEDWKGTNQQLIDVVLTGRFMERLGDHAVSAARRVVFIVSGFDPSKEPTRDEGTDID